MHDAIRWFKCKLKPPKNERGMYDEIYTVKAYMGPDPSLPPKLEERIRMYVTD